MGARFSKRTAWDLGDSALSAAVKTARAAGRELVDLTVANPTACGFEYGADAVLGALSNPQALTYDPEPRGMLTARASVSEYYRSMRAEVDPERLILTTSTSEAYSFLFRLLCDAGDEVLVAQPSYPLFDFLAALDDVRLQAYPLFYDFGWWIDFAELERRITSRTRAILLVHPNNPTGHGTPAVERDQLEAVCVRHNLALIVDEVFLDYSLGPRITSFAAGEHPCLTFVISGISKIAALPQMKVGWLAAFGADAPGALERLEVIADTFLSLNAPAQLALPYWLSGREAIQKQVMGRVRANLELLAETRYLTFLPMEAGWSVVMQVPQSRAADGLAEELVRDAGVIVHPGSFYGIAGRHRVVASLVVPVATFKEGIERLESWCEPEALSSGGGR